MIVGEHTRDNDLEINVMKGKQLTNIRTHSKDEAVRLTPPIQMTLEKALAYIDEDELVEVTPQVDPPAQDRSSTRTTASARSGRRKARRKSRDRLHNSRSRERQHEDLELAHARASPSRRGCASSVLWSGRPKAASGAVFSHAAGVA